MKNAELTTLIKKSSDAELRASEYAIPAPPVGTILKHKNLECPKFLKDISNKTENKA